MKRAQRAAESALTPAPGGGFGGGNSSSRVGGGRTKAPRSLDGKLLKSPLFASFDDHFGGSSGMKQKKRKQKKKKNIRRGR